MNPRHIEVATRISFNMMEKKYEDRVAFIQMAVAQALSATEERVREECARVAERGGGLLDNPGHVLAINIATAIRAQSQEEGK